MGAVGPAPAASDSRLVTSSAGKWPCTLHAGRRRDNQAEFRCCRQMARKIAAPGDGWRKAGLGKLGSNRQNACEISREISMGRGSPCLLQRELTQKGRTRESRVAAPWWCCNPGPTVTPHCCSRRRLRSRRCLLVGPGVDSHPLRHTAAADTAGALFTPRRDCATLADTPRPRQSRRRRQLSAGGAAASEGWLLR